MLQQSASLGQGLDNGCVAFLLYLKQIEQSSLHHSTWWETLPCSCRFQFESQSIP